MSGPKVTTRLFARFYAYFSSLYLCIIIVWILNLWIFGWFGWQTSNIFQNGNGADYFFSCVFFGGFFAIWDPLKIRYAEPIKPKAKEVKTKVQKRQRADRVESVQTGPSKTAKAALALSAYNLLSAKKPTKMPVITSSQEATNINIVHKKNNIWVLTYGYVHLGSGRQAYETREITPSTGQVAIYNARINLRWKSI